MRITCAYPVPMFELVGRVSDTGKKVIVHNYPGSGVRFKALDRDCDRCTGCTVRRRMALATRLEHEAMFHQFSWFVTLTYSDEHLPYGGSLVMDHVSEFLKRFRDRKRGKTRFFAVGEYGTTCQAHGVKDCQVCGSLHRPHYHLILFGPDIPDRILTYSKPDFRSTSTEFERMFGRAELDYFSSPSLDKAWAKGFVNFTPVSPATMQYVAKYHVEKVTGDRAFDHYVRCLDDETLVELEHPKARMSNRPGLGRKWIEKYWTDVYPDGLITSKDGKQFKAPEYYDRWMEENQPEVWAETQARREDFRDFEMEFSERRKAVDECRKAQLKHGSI